MRPIALSALSLACLALPAQDALVNAITGGKASLEIRTRYEWDSDANYTAPADKKTANALTNRTILGYTTGSFYDVTATLQLSNVTALRTEAYDSTINGQTQYAKVTDPGLTEFLQGFLEWKGVKVGRQILSVDNERFIEAGLWNQTPKTFTGATFKGNFGLSWMELHAGHLIRVHDSVGVNTDIRGEFARIRFTPCKFLAVTPFYYAFNLMETPASSYVHRGLRADGSWNGFLYEASYAQQRGYKESTTTQDRNYRMGMVGYQYKDMSLKAVREELEGGFSTPQAGLHSYYGWSDRISTTPTNGLVDSYLKFEAKQWSCTFEVQAHRFTSQVASQNYGRELDIQVARPLTKYLTVTAKYADYRGDSEAPTTSALNKDLRRYWLMTTFKF